jgi:hypothetical protein
MTTQALEATDAFDQAVEKQLHHAFVVVEVRTFQVGQVKLVNLLEKTADA